MTPAECNHCGEGRNLTETWPGTWLCQRCIKEGDVRPLPANIVAVAWAARQNPVIGQGHVIAVPPNKEPPPFPGIMVPVGEGKTNHAGGSHTKLAFLPLHLVNENWVSP